MDILTNSLQSIIILSIPIIILVLAELIVEKLGFLNLGINGIILLSAVISAIVFHNTNSLWMAVFSGSLAGIIIMVLLGIARLYLHISLLVLGLGITLLGERLSIFLGKGFISPINMEFFQVQIPLLNRIPIIGEVFFSQNIWLFLTILIFSLFWYVLNKTDFGVVFNALGYDPQPMHNRGFNVSLIQLIIFAISGFLIGLAGALFVLMIDNGWRGSNLTFGIVGWMVFPLVIISNWKPIRSIVVVIIFCIFEVVFTQSGFLNQALPLQFVQLLPEISIFLILVLINIGNKSWNLEPVNEVLNQEKKFVENLLSALQAKPPKALTKSINKEG